MADGALPPGSTIGILGGGQLARMLTLAAARLGLKTVIFDPDPQAPAAQVTAIHICASYDDADALDRFVTLADVVTYEFENIPTAALDHIERSCDVRPGRNALATSQDRLEEKTFLTSIGLEVAPFAPVDSAEDVGTAVVATGVPAILKTRRFGYDGKGQATIATAEEGHAAISSFAGAPAILEGRVHFDREISVIAARGTDGSVVCFDPGENVHVDGILHTTTVPGKIPRPVALDAVVIAGRILNALDYVGVLGVELFQVGNRLLVNEIAPRVHNSGHWTQNACAVDQFEQHIRAVAGWPLGDGIRHADAVMTNLIGDDALRWDEARDGALHLYGKAEVRPGRKMGHVTQVTPRDV